MHISLPAASLPQADTTPEFCKAVILKISTHLFALPTTAIVKIVSAASVSQSHHSITLWENTPLLLLDLHQLLGVAPPQLENPTAEGKDLKSYLVITRTSSFDRCAITVDELPIFENIPLSKVQALSPYHYRLMGSIAKHRVILPYKGVSSTILLLDLQHALYRWQMMKHSIS
ncbi:MAG TPA: chemotaxis protein CheW [Allocoleopsis sp.]